MRRRNSAILVVAVSIGLVASPVPANLELPAGLRVTLRLVDHVNTEHEPLGQTFRALLQEKVTIGGKLIAEEKSRALLRLVPGAGGGVRLDWFAIRLGEEWAEMRVLDEPGGGVSVLTKVEDRRPSDPDAKPLVSRGPRLYIPAGSVLHFELKRPARLVNVGRESF